MTSEQRGVSVNNGYRVREETEMASVDIFFQDTIRNYILPCFVALLCYMLFKHQIHAIATALRMFKLVRVKDTYNQLTWKEKKRLLSLLQDYSLTHDRPLRLLELAIGCGHNIPLYPSGVDCLAVDSHPYFKRYVDAYLEDYPHVTLVDFVVCDLDQLLSIPDGCLDAVVCTGVLTQMDKLDSCLAEVKRILRPLGQLYFLEPVTAASVKNSFSFHYQNLCSRLRSLLGGEICPLGIDPSRNIQAAGFAIIKLKHFKVKKPGSFFAKWWVCPPYMQQHISGIALKPEEFC